jgi:hypothetical protein
MDIKLEDIDKATAERLLLFNDGNRPLRPHHVDFFSRCLQNGDFKTTHQGIALAGTLRNPVRLFDGQHRLAAIAATGITARLAVAENAFVGCFENADSGLTRTMSDRTKLHSKEVEACVAFFYMVNQSNKSKPSTGMIQRIHAVIGQQLAELPCVNKRGLSAVGFRCAFTLQNYVYGENDYSLFAAECPEKAKQLLFLNPALFALKSRILQSGGGPRMRNYDSFSAIWQAVTDKDRKRFLMNINAAQFAAETITKNWPELAEIINGK